MALFKRGKSKRGIWQYDFQWNGKRFQGSSGHTNKEAAAAWLRAFRTNLINEGVGLVKQKPLPLLTDFLSNEFTQHVEQQSKTAGTKIAYRKSIKRMVAAPCFQSLPLDQVTDREISAYKQWRLGKENTPATVNGDLAVLRKALRWADRGLKLIRYQGVTSLPGENKRTFTLSGELEKVYLAVVPYPLKQVAILMLDLGLRPEEAVSLRKEDVTEETVTVRHGKSTNARRSLPQTSRTRDVFRFLFDLFPDATWVFPGRLGKHMTAHAISNLHGLTRIAFNEGLAIAGRNNTNTVHRRAEMLPLAVSAVSAPWPDEFVLYSLRHTFATRAAESGMDLFTLSKLLGHYSLKITERYVHIGVDHAAVAMKQAEIYGKMLRGEAAEFTADSTNAGKASR